MLLLVRLKSALQNLLVTQLEIQQVMQFLQVRLDYSRLQDLTCLLAYSGQRQFELHAQHNQQQQNVCGTFQRIDRHVLE